MPIPASERRKMLAVRLCGPLAMRTRSAKSSAAASFARSDLSKSGQVMHSGAFVSHISIRASRAAVVAKPASSVFVVAVRHLSRVSLQS